MAIKHICIPKPCHEQWQQMTPVNGGRYCDHCCKTVTDFTVMSNAEIIKQLSARNNVCGRFEQRQLVEINSSIAANKKWSFSWISLLVASVISLTHVPRAEARTKHNFEQGEFPVKSHLNIPVPAETQVTIQGVITEKGSGSVLPGTEIRCKNGYRTSSNADGMFKLIDVSETDTLTFSFIGYKTQQIAIADIANKSEFKIEMEVKEMTEFVVVGGAFVRHSFVHRLWHKIKNIF